jgi:hypothetical protein
VSHGMARRGGAAGPSAPPPSRTHGAGTASTGHG